MGKNTGSGRLLIVDGEACERTLVRGILGQGGYEVFEADSAADAIAKAAGLQRPADAVIINSEIRPSLELLRRLREIWPEVPAILGCDLTTAPDSVSAESGPFTHFLAKPFQADTLAPLLNRILRRPGRGLRP